MKDGYILSLDQGTTSSRAILFDKQGKAVAQSARKHEQIFPQAGWVSHNLNEIYFNVVENGKIALENAAVSASQIAAIGITNQRETLAAWNRDTGEPVFDAIVWQCRRTADICKQMSAEGLEETVRSKTGLLIDPYFTGAKVKWLLAHVENARTLLKQGKLLIGTVDSFLIWKLTGGQRYVTDMTNASRTMLFNIHMKDWDEELLKYFGVPRAALPEIVPSSGKLGVTDPEIFGGSICIAGVAGDQHAALFGHTCFQKGDVKNTYGSGCFILVNTGEEPVLTKSKLLTTVAWHIHGKTTYALEGSIFAAGSAIEWLIDKARLANDVEEMNHICETVTDTDGVYFVPAFSGLGAPHWDMYARGAVLGMSLSTSRRHLVRAVMESIAYQTKDVLDYIAQNVGIDFKQMNADGGISRSPFIMQFQSDIMNLDILRPRSVEITALGAAYLAGLGVGFWKDFNELKELHVTDCFFHPSMTAEDRMAKYSGWQSAVERSKGWIQVREA